MKLLHREEAIKAMQKADDALQSASHDLKGGFYLATANRAYYASFYCMVGLLYTKGVFAKTHAGVHTKFSELFIKGGAFPAETSEVVSDLFSARQDADYDFDAKVDEDEAAELVEKASRFVALVKEYFQEIGNEEE